MLSLGHRAIGPVLAAVRAVGAAARTHVSDPPTRVSVRNLALVTGLASVIAQVLSHISASAPGAHDGPWGVVIGQALYNGAQVGLLLLLLGLWCVGRSRWIAALAVVTLVGLPFAIYAISPGGWALTALLLAVCALTWSRGVPDLSVAVVDAPARGTPLLVKFEFLALVCNLLCSMYNFMANDGVWPHWSSIYAAVSGLIGFTAEPAAIAQGMFGLGIADVGLPAYIKVGRPVEGLGAVMFAVIWAVLPFLYVLYFALLAKQAKHSPGTRIQQALCAVAIVHFLFLTDIVDYRFGRGIVSPAAEWCHWLEVFIWRLAIILPIYQKVMSGQWRNGNGRVGVAVHYGFGAWAAGFFVYEVLMYNSRFFYAWATGTEYNQIMLFGRGYAESLGWHGALVLMVFLYGFTIATMRCKRIVAEPAPAPGLSPRPASR
jgi:hypothetical protein